MERQTCTKIVTARAWHCVSTVINHYTN